MTENTLVSASILGVSRSIVVETLVYPLEVIKTHMQTTPQKTSSYTIAIKLFKEENWRAFYRGYPPHLVRSSINQIWYWPMMMALPPQLEKQGFTPLNQQLITGLTISSISSLIATPFESVKFASIFKTNEPVLGSLKRASFATFSAQYAKSSVRWAAFLASQNLLRDSCEKKTGKKERTLRELVDIGVKVACIVSFTSAPFDFLNTLVQKHSIDKTKLLSTSFKNPYRGWPISFVSLVIQNVASAIVINKIKM